MNEDSIRKTISINISKYREQAGFTQKELASKLGVTPSRVSNWEQGANSPTIDILFKVCEALNISINDIYGVYPDSKIRMSYDEIEHIKKYRNLDDHGREMVDFTLAKEYERSIALAKEKESMSNVTEFPDHLKVKAAHARTDIEVTNEMKQHDDDIMESDDF